MGKKVTCNWSWRHFRYTIASSRTDSLSIWGDSEKRMQLKLEHYFILFCIYAYVQNSNLGAIRYQASQCPESFLDFIIFSLRKRTQNKSPKGRWIWFKLWVRGKADLFMWMKKCCSFPLLDCLHGWSINIILTWKWWFWILTIWCCLWIITSFRH